MSTCAKMRLPRVQLRVPMQWTRYYSESLASSTTASSQTSTATANTTPSADNVDSNVDADVEAFKKAAKLRRTVKKHLSNSSDPYIIAQHVETILKKDQYDEALLLTQQASKDQNVVVAWNHLIGYQLEKQRLKAGMKLYNDMKKRSQLPNVQTFTIIFRGLSKSQHPKLAVAEAVKLYNVLLADRRLQPNSIHLNAVLSVCSRANDLDSLFLIANTLNDSTRAATPYTYTTILNALRHHALKENAPSDTLSDEQTATNLQRTVDRARSIWVEVIEKWQAGKLVVDEELVCAMGRVQLLSPKREQKRQVLDLLTQTMNIPNLTLPSPPALTPNTSGPIPGRNTLALILTTLASAKLTSAGMKYWSLLTSTYNIHPDPDNYLRLLGMLKVAKASASSSTAIATLPETSPIYTSPKPYRIAMETCVRDNINNNVTTHSTAILNHMLSRVDVPDLHTLRLYLRVALVSHYAFRKNPNQDAGKASYGTQLTTALGNLWEPYKKTHYHYFKATPTPATKTEKAILYNNQREVIALARHMFSAFNKVINEKMLPDAELKDLRRVGAKINKEIVKFYEDREEIEPNLKKFTKARFDNNRANDNTGDYKKSSVRNDDGDSFYEEDPLESGDLRHGGDFVWRTNRPLTQETTRRSAPSV